MSSHSKGRISTNQRGAAQPGAKFPFATTSAVSASVSALFALSLPGGLAQAQEAAAQGSMAELAPIVVSGIRASIEQAIDTKREADSIVESISAEDIGKLPDTSIAESIARLPGLAAQRVNGRASAISVRGFSPGFSTALLNGREQVSTGDSRFVEFDQYPSELMSGVVVYKTGDASLVDQGLAATIDMKTVRPLAFGKTAFAANTRKESLGRGLSTPSGSGSRSSVSYIDQFADNTIGVAIGYANLQELTGQTQNFSSWGTNTTTFGGVSVRAPGGFNDLVDQTRQSRDGAMVTLEYKPNSKFHSTVDYFYTKFDQDLLEQGVQAPLVPWQTNGGQGYAINPVLSAATVVNGVATAGTITQFKATSRNDATATHDAVHSLGWNNTYKFDDHWTGTVDLARSDAKRHAPHIETTAGLAGNCNTTPAACGTASWTGFDGNNVAGAHYTFTPNLSDPTVNLLTDVMGWGGNISSGASTTPQAGYTKTPDTDDRLNAYRLSAKRDLGKDLFFSDIDFGLNYSDRTKTRTITEGRLLVGTTGNPFAGAPVPGVAATSPVTGVPYLAWNPDGSVGSIYSVAAKLVPDITNKDWKVHEKVLTAFANLNVDSKFLGNPLRGNVGLQLVHTDQGSTAFLETGQPCPGDVCPTATNTDGAKYYDILPTVNLVSELPSDQVLRLGIGRQMARPTLDDMRASTDFSVNNTYGYLTGRAGNPELKPFRSNSIDLSYEKYFAKKGYVSAAVFYKKLNSYILNSTTGFDYTTLVNAQTPLPPSGATLGTITRPVNGTGGRVDGYELAASVPFSLATSWLEGFGLQASLSMTNSSVVMPTVGFNTGNINTLTIPMPGLSRKVEGFAFYYERYGFSARIAQRYRGNFVGSIADVYGDSQLVFVKAERINDLQVGYDIQSGPAKGLSLVWQVNNLNNAPYIEYRDVPTNESTHVTYGRTYLMGLNYRY